MFCNQGKIIIDVYFVTVHIISLKLYLFSKDVLLPFFFFAFSLITHCKDHLEICDLSSCTPEGFHRQKIAWLLAQGFNRLQKLPIILRL